MGSRWRALLLLTTILGAIACEAYHKREMQEHCQALQELQVRKPTVAQVDAAIGATLYRTASPANAKELSTIWTNPLNSPAEVEANVSRWPQTRVYLKSPVVYLIYFDDGGVMQDSSCLSN